MRLIPTKKDIAFVEYMDEGSATMAKDALHNYKLDGENKIKVCRLGAVAIGQCRSRWSTDYIREEVRSSLLRPPLPLRAGILYRGVRCCGVVSSVYCSIITFLKANSKCGAHPSCALRTT